MTSLHTWGAAPNAPADPNAPAVDPNASTSGFSIDGLKNGLKQITPTLLLVGIATGAAFAVGSALASYVIKHKDHGRTRAARR